MDNKRPNKKAEEEEISWPLKTPTRGSFLSESTVLYENHFRPTSPGSNLGAAHLRTKQKVTKRLQ